MYQRGYMVLWGIFFIIILSVGLVVGVATVQNFKLFTPRANQASLAVRQAEYSDMKIVTHYGAGIMEYDSNTLLADIPKMKATGFNTLFMVTPWNNFMASANPNVYKDNSFNRLKEVLKVVKENNMKVIIPMNYLGKEWKPVGIDACQWIWKEDQYKSFEAYTTEFLTRIQDYADITYVMVFTEGTESTATGTCDLAESSAVYANPEPYAKQLQKTLGSLPTRMPQNLRQKFKFGYHDYSLINLDWGKGHSPIADPIPFDFVSMVLYGMEDKSEAEIKAEIDLREFRFRKLYPNTPLIMGESGASSCIGNNTPENQSRVWQVIANHAVSKKLAFNVWAWKPHVRVECDPNSSTGGTAITNFDGSNKPAVDVIKKAITPSIDKPVDLVQSYNPWVGAINGKNITSFTRVQLFVNGSKWGNDITPVLGEDHTWVSFSLPSNTAPNNCNVGKTCIVSVKLFDIRSGLVSNESSFTLPPVSVIATPISSVTPRPTSLGTITISSSGVTTSYNPWAGWVIATNLHSNTAVRLYDSNGTRWGNDITPVLSADKKSLSFSYPANNPPSNCNKTKTCVIKVSIFDKSSNKESTKFNVTLPKY